MSRIAFLSGSFPVALVNLLLVCDSNSFAVKCFAILFFTVTIFSAIIFYSMVQKRFNEADAPCHIENLHRVNPFFFGVMAFYIAPFVAFVGNNEQNTIILIALISVLFLTFTNNNLLYTPFLDFLGYKVLRGDIVYPSANLRINAYIIVKDNSDLYFSGCPNDGFITKVTETTYFFQGG